MRIFIIVLVSIFFTGLFISSAKESHKDPKTLFEETCAECHSLDIPKSMRLSRAEWEKIVNRMKSNGLSINEKDEEIIIEFLSSTYGVK